MISNITTTNNRVRPRIAGDWLVSPAFDLLVLANLSWLLALLPGAVSNRSGIQLEFWQLYFLTSPHRWIALVATVADHQRRGSPAIPLTAAGGMAALIISVGALGQGIAILIAIDLVVSAVHYAWQHVRVADSYTAHQPRQSFGIAKTLLAALSVYANLRVAAWMFGWPDSAPTGIRVLAIGDLVFLAMACIVAWLAWRERGAHPQTDDVAPIPCGARYYIWSVTAIYGAIVIACMRQSDAYIASLVVALAAFHATEFLAMLSLAVWSRRDLAPARSVWKFISQNWLLALSCSVIGFGVGSAWADHQFHQAFLALNLWASLTHSCCDAWLWRRGFLPADTENA